MADIRSRSRSLLATIIGWVVVVLVLFWVFHFIIGTIEWILRFAFAIVVVGVLLTLYMKLKSPKSRA